ncbi:MAG: type II toxin-antitoxin system RelE/ParE family toxin [Nanoarchaeota archaeon]|nr:type II toxin-antitoxin system RelE/ParE family toxin [Nanoarchaeota archaeon]MBU1005692.1 type II toxin-antitoxin system RelE/ParE family toxin [Nanoarchaeota archaeon]MBU1946417.1 type II toxin-antitoxin system RelE/ParE family toxin [Nanoarchaeota archaeon]
MNYAVKWHPQAFKILKKLPDILIQRVLSKMDIVMQDPFHFLEHYEGENLYKLRIGDYRALIEVNSEQKLLLVQVFDHRAKVYKR